MKYFNPSYWFKLWVLSAPLFNDKTQGINAKSIDNKKIKDWASKDITSLESINEYSNLTNSSNNYQPYSLNETNQNINPIYQTELETSTHKHRHVKSRNRHKRQNWNNVITRSLVLKYENGQLDHESYLISLGNIIQDLINHEIIIHGPGTSSSDTDSYIINPAFISENNQDKNFFRIPIELDDTNASLVSVLRSSDFYLQGFILNNDNYYYFSDSTINFIINMNNIRLSISSEYPQGINLQITWGSVIDAFSFLTEFNNNNYNDNNKKKTLQKNIIILALVTSESLRFQNIANNIHSLEQDWELSYDWNTQFAPIVKNWNSFSKKVVSDFFDSIDIENSENNVRLLTLKAGILSVEYCLFQEKKNTRQKKHITTFPHYHCLKGNFYEKDCIFERVSNFFSSSNSIKLKLTYTMWNKIEVLKELLCNNVQDFKNSLKKIINNFPQNYPSTAQNEEDKNAMVEIIIEHYDNIKNKFSFREDYPNSKFLVIQGGTDKWFGGAVFHDANNRKDMRIYDELRKKRSYTISTDKWTDYFTKSINHEQHLPIDNTTNFVNSNITSL